MLFAKCPRPPGRWENAIRETIWKTVQRANNLFGAMVEYHPISTRDQSRLHQFGKEVLPGTFLGYELVVERIWKGDIPIADLEDLEN